MHCGKGSCGQCADGLPENGAVYNNTHGRFYTFTFLPDYSTVFPDLVLQIKKAEYEKRNNELHLQTMKEMEIVNQKTEKGKECYNRGFTDSGKCK